MVAVQSLNFQGQIFFLFVFATLKLLGARLLNFICVHSLFEQQFSPSRYAHRTRVRKLRFLTRLTHPQQQQQGSTLSPNCERHNFIRPPLWAFRSTRVLIIPKITVLGGRVLPTIYRLEL